MQTVHLLPPSPFKHQDRIKCTKKAGKNLAASSLHLMTGSIQIPPSMKGTTPPQAGHWQGSQTQAQGQYSSQQVQLLALA